MINAFVLDIKPGGRHWISKALLYEPTKNGGFGLINLHHFTNAIKCSWIKRYCIDNLDDHWADLLDKHFNITPETRKSILTYGPERFNKLIKLNIPGLSSIFAAYKAMKSNFPTQPDSFDNSWLCQNVFFNQTFNRKLPKGKKETFLTPTFYGIPDKYHTLTVRDFFPGGTFISQTALNTLTGTTLIKMNYDNLKVHIRSKIGTQKHYDAIPLMNLPQKKNTHQNVLSLMSNIKKGSGKYRTILHKQSTPKELHSPTNWRSKLNDTTITSKHIKQFRKNLQSRYISSEIACKITRLKLGKTLFGNQLPHIGSDETTFCKTCIRETQTETVEDLAHATFMCPHTQTIIDAITQHFFPENVHTLTPKDIILSCIDNLHKYYEGKPGQILFSLVWDNYLYYIMTCRAKNTTPIQRVAIENIKQTIINIITILPKTMVSKHILASNELKQIFGV